MNSLLRILGFVFGLYLMNTQHFIFLNMWLFDN